MGTLELVEKMMFIRMMQRMKLVTLATSRKAQAKSSKSGGGREAGTPWDRPQAPSLAGRGLSLPEPRGIVKPSPLRILPPTTTLPPAL